jgi:hypothetical protein
LTQRRKCQSRKNKIGVFLALIFKSLKPSGETSRPGHGQNDEIKGFEKRYIFPQTSRFHCNGQKRVEVERRRGREV